MRFSPDRASEEPVLEIGEEDILVEESWLDREWAEMLAASALTRSATEPGDPQPPGPILTSSSSTQAILACTMELEGLLFAVVLDTAGARVLVDRSGPDYEDAIPALAALWKSCCDLATAVAAPVDELVVRGHSASLAYRRVAGTPAVLCALVDSAKTNDALLRMSMAKLCG